MLFFKECKKIIFSITFLLFLAALTAFYFTQYGFDRMPKAEPVPGQESYGTIKKEVPEVLMENATASLLSEYSAGTYIAYPYGFIKYVRLSSDKSAQMSAICDELTRKPAPSYKRFRELMEEADHLIGGGSGYGKEYLLNFSQVPMTYEEALAEYQDFLNKDKISGAYARLFCDYMCITLSFLPVFVITALCLKDKSAKMQDLIYFRRLSSFRLVCTRYLACLTVVFLPVLLFATHAALSLKGLYHDKQPELWPFFIYALVWLLPSVMISLSTGMFLTELTETPISILFQGVWFLLDINTGGLTGSIGRFTLAPRHNSLFDRNAFIDNWRVFAENRLLYTLAAFILLLLTAALYEQKRRGRLYGFRLFKHS